MKRNGRTKKKTHSNLPKEAEQLGRGQMKKKLAMKEIQYKTSFMKERRDKVHARLIRRCAAIEDLFYSSRYITLVQE